MVLDNKYFIKVKKIKEIDSSQIINVNCDVKTLSEWLADIEDDEEFADTIIEAKKIRCLIKK